MRKFFSFFFLFACALAWATDYNVGTDSELRAAIQNNNANITVTADIDLSNSTLSIESGDTVTINLGGFTLDRKLTQRGEGGGQVITVREGATLNLSNGTLKGGWGGNGGGIANESGTVNLTNVTITGCTGDDSGGGICNLGGTLTMTGGALTANTCNDHGDPTGGAGIFNASGATATLKSVTVTGNKVVTKGGGGICNYGTMTLDSCTISGNTCGKNGGGIYAAIGSTLNMQGKMTITDNKGRSDQEHNLFLKEGMVITVTGSLAGSNIGISMEDVTGTFTSGYNTHNSGVDPATFFQSEWPDIMDVTLENNEAKLGSSLAEGDYYYIDNHWSNGKLTYETKILHPGEYKLIKPGYYEDTDLNMSGTYVVTTNDKGYKCHYDGIAYVTANTKIILCDGAKLEINGCLFVAENEVILDVYGQVNNTGVLQAHGDITHYGENYPGIGSGQDKATDMHFHGGHIIAKGENSYEGIGGGHAGHNHSKIYFYNANVEATGGSGGAGIGTWIDAKDDDDDDLNIYIYGGTIKAWGGSGFGDKYAAGIGGGYDAPGVNLFVYGGEVYAYGAANAAGIGGGWDGDGGWTEVRGGLVKAYGGENGAGIGSGSNEWMNEDIPPSARMLKIFGGEVYAYGGVDAAGVGGGEDCDGGTLEVYGGYLYAEGNDNGAGIGGGEDGKGTWVTIYGGTVVAKTTGTDEGSRAIGPGDGNDDYRSLDIGYDMMVTSERKFTAAERKNACWYRTNVRVEVCDHSDGFTYTVDGTGPNDHHISHCPYCLHTDTALHTFDANGVCTVCGVQATAYDVKLYLPLQQNDGSYDGETYLRDTTMMVVPESAFILPVCATDVPGFEFRGWAAITDVTGDTLTSSYTTTGETLLDVGDRDTIHGNVSYVPRYQVLDITLYDDAPNLFSLLKYQGLTAHSVTFSGHTLYKDGDWNTLCLPFALSADSIAAGPLAGCTLMELDTEGTYETNKQTGYVDSTQTLNLFFKTATAIEAGKPYLIKWASGTDITNPVFTSVTIDKTMHAVRSDDGTVIFAATYNPIEHAAERKDVLFLGANNTFYWPDGVATTTVPAFHGYFALRGIKAGDPAAAAPGLRIVSNLNDATGVAEVRGQMEDVRVEKFIKEGIIYIRRGGITYDAMGKIIRER